MILQQAVELFQLSNNVVLDIRSRDLKSHAAAVKRTGEITGEHLIDHPSYNWNYLFEKIHHISPGAIIDCNTLI